VKLDHKGWAVLVIVLGVVVAGSYTLGRKQGTPPAESTSTDAGVLAPGTQLPGDHPPLSSAAMPPPPPMSGVAVPSAMPPAVGNGAAKFTHFRVGNRNVKGLFIDGPYAWIGTSGGVIRYDINNDIHKTFDNKVDGLISNGIFHVSKIDGKIYVGTYGGGLSVYDPPADSWKNYNIPEGLADQFVYDVHKAGNGDLWVATWSGANRIKGGRLDDPSSWMTFDVENTAAGLPNRWVYALEEGSDGSLWFATEEGLARYHNGQWKNWKHSDGLGAPYEQVKEAIKSTNDPARASKHHARNKQDQGLQDVNVAYNPNYIISLKVDAEGVVWAGTWGAGLARFDGKSWKNYTTADGLPANHVFMLYIDPEGQLWVGTNHGLAKMRVDGSGFDTMTTADGLFANNVFSMAHAKDGTMWVGSFGGVARIAPDKN